MTATCDGELVHESEVKRQACKATSTQTFEGQLHVSYVLSSAEVKKQRFVRSYISGGFLVISALQVQRVH
jgi:hypothetical protein